MGKENPWTPEYTVLGVDAGAKGGDQTIVCVRIDAGEADPTSVARLIANAPAMADRLMRIRQYVVVAIMDGRKSGLSAETIKIAERDLVELDALLATIKGDDHG